MDQLVKYTAIGRRKESVARINLTPGKGEVFVNDRPYEKYFLRETDRIIVMQPFKVTNNQNKFDVIARINGGGLTGQAGALRLAISRALSLADTVLKDPLRKEGYLTRDPRAKERKKYGQKGARKRFQWTKR